MVHSSSRNIVGADEYIKNGDPEGDIKGITTNDKTGEIKIDLISPDASFSNILATNFAGLVPGDTLQEPDRGSAAGVGAYAITKSVPKPRIRDGEEPEFRQLQDSADPDRSRRQDHDRDHQERQPAGAGRWPTSSTTCGLRRRPTWKPDRGGGRHQTVETTTGSTYYFFCEHAGGPFNDPKVRQAVNYGIDKPGLARIFAGELAPAASAARHAGYNEAFDTTDCPYGDPTAAGPREGEAADQGGWCRRHEMASGANNDDPTDKVTEAYADMLNQMGFGRDPEDPGRRRLLPDDRNQKTKVQTGFRQLVPGFPHPLNFSFLRDGDSISGHQQPELRQRR